MAGCAVGQSESSFLFCDKSQAEWEANETFQMNIKERTGLVVFSPLEASAVSHFVNQTAPFDYKPH